MTYDTKHKKLTDLIAAEIAANPVELDGFQWCGLPQSVITAKLGFSVETLRRLIGKPPIVRKRRKGVTLLRVGKPGPKTNYDRAQIMSAIWRKLTGKQTTLHQFKCLLGLAGEWPEDHAVTLFKLPLWNFAFFSGAIKQHMDEANSIATADGKPLPYVKRFYEFPTIPYIRRFAFIVEQCVVDYPEEVETMLAEMNAAEAGKPVPTWCKAINPEAWKTLKPGK